MNNEIIQRLKTARLRSKSKSATQVLIETSKVSTTAVIHQQPTISTPSTSKTEVTPAPTPKPKPIPAILFINNGKTTSEFSTTGYFLRTVPDCNHDIRIDISAYDTLSIGDVNERGFVDGSDLFRRLEQYNLAPPFFKTPCDKCVSAPWRKEEKPSYRLKLVARSEPEANNIFKDKKEPVVIIENTCYAYVDHESFEGMDGHAIATAVVELSKIGYFTVLEGYSAVINKWKLYFSRLCMTVYDIPLRSMIDIIKNQKTEMWAEDEEIFDQEGIDTCEMPMTKNQRNEIENEIRREVQVSEPEVDQIDSVTPPPDIEPVEGEYVPFVVEVPGSRQFRFVKPYLPSRYREFSASQLMFLCTMRAGLPFFRKRLDDANPGHIFEFGTSETHHDKMQNGTLVEALKIGLCSLSELSDVVSFAFTEDGETRAYPIKVTLDEEDGYILITKM